MTVKQLKELLDLWTRTKFTGIITVYLNQGGLRSVKKEEEVGKLREAGKLLDAETILSEGRLLYHPDLGVINDKGGRVEEDKEE